MSYIYGNSTVIDDLNDRYDGKSDKKVINITGY